MAAMMLPGAVPAVLGFVATTRRAIGVPLFAASYLAVWTLFGLVVYSVYQPHRTWVAGALTIGAGLYEVTPIKRRCRRRCHETMRSGLQLGVYCVGSSVGLMVMLAALGVMNVGWMALVAALVLVQKLLRPRWFIDVPVAIGIVTLGVAVLTRSA
jgi:predicted metal-binding membrane protein